MIGRRRPRELPVLEPAAARMAALEDADGNGVIPAQARTRAALRSAGVAWVALVGATATTRTERITAHNRHGTPVDVDITITVQPRGARP